MKISEHVYYSEVIHSDTAVAKGINNEPSAEQLELIKACAVNIYDKVRNAAEGPVKINSIFRSDDLNKAIKGSRTSQHSVGLDPSKNSYGAAFDLDDDHYYKGLCKMNNRDMFHYIKDNLDFDQLIWEFGTKDFPKWIHVSYRPDNKNRKQILIATMVKGVVKYLPYESNKHLTS